MNRSRIVKVRVTEAEYADWSKRALEASVSLSEAIRRAMKGNIHPEAHIASESLQVVEPYDVSWATTARFSPRATILTNITPPEYISTNTDPNCEHGRPRYVFCPKCPRD